MRAPTSTYRLQLSPQFGFEDARARLDYVERLGIGALYLSPIFAAAPGSEHGYDVVDPNRVSEALGGEEAFRELAEDACGRGLGVLLDFVPNHMAARWENPWWRDVLTHGRASRYAEFFDIDWDRPAGPTSGKIVLPVLGEGYARVLDAGEVSIEWVEEGFRARYHDRRLPLDPSTWPRLFGETLEDARLPESLVEILRGLERLPPPGARDRPAREERAREAERLASRLADSTRSDEGIRDAVDRAIARHDASDPAGRERLDALLVDQPWWLVHWRHAGEEINYRRFFTIADLVGVAVEREEVFHATHQKLGELIGEDLVTGVRVDHVDGLHEPTAYLERLRGLDADRDLYVVVEKILARDERIPERWEVAGTTGYDFLARADGLAVDPEGLRRIEGVYRLVTGTRESFEDLAYRTRWEVATESFTGDLKALAGALLPHVREDPRGRDVTAGQVGEALVEVTASMPVYRTYLCEEPIDAHDRRALEVAFARARGRTDLPANVWDALRGVLSLESGAGPIEVCRRWQQLSGAIMAKGVEDTAFYAYNPLLSLNEVGTDPSEGITSAAAFHEWAAARAAEWPGSLNATSTHDTKRSADVRARIATLSWDPDEWAERLERWRAWNVEKKSRVAGEPAPGPAREVALYQTLLGAWPDDPAEIPSFLERLERYLPKAIREARLHGDWTDPDAEYEEAVVAFARRIVEGAEGLAGDGASGDGEAGGARAPEALAEENPFLADFL
ncbi:MAG: malto-oligosyltrehalose synthase, partial [Gemmatimonadota bacterium]|nr:malto-oligosyltrehalose synthase [Gemmatimonadota bacterium]